MQDSNQKKTLLTFTGYHDPFAPGLVGEEKQIGPVLSLAEAVHFDRIVLFGTPKTERETQETRKEIQARYPETVVEVLEIVLPDPTDYAAILAGIRSHLPFPQNEELDQSFFIGVSSGTPQMHVCWVLLAASGEIPARLLMTRPPKFVTKSSPPVKEIDLTTPEFPRVRSGVWKTVDSTLATRDLATAIGELGIVGEHPNMMKRLEQTAMLASVNIPVLILGESGTGKELFSKLVHRLSDRATGPFVALNCANISSELAESILFGHVRGAFTGAASDHAGKFELADKGTLFLDELAELSLSVQAKLLRVLEEGIVERVGSQTGRKVDVRIVAATNKDLELSVSDGSFREDLYYRLNAGEISLPPLRERRTDIPLLALHLLDKINTQTSETRSLSPEALTRLQRQPWPGNIRDLENAILRSVLFSRKRVLEADDLILGSTLRGKDPLTALPEPHEGFSLDAFLAAARKQLVLKALNTAGGNQSEAARLLGITPQAVHKFVKQIKSG